MTPLSKTTKFRFEIWAADPHDLNPYFLRHYATEHEAWKKAKGLKKQYPTTLLKIYQVKIQEETREIGQVG